MPEQRITMLDAVKANAADDVVGLVEEVDISAPEFGLFPFRSIKGTSYKTRHRTGYPDVNFRGVNGGVNASKSSFDLREVQCYLIDALIEADKANAAVYEDGPDQFKFEEALGVMEAAMIKFGSQCYYGNPGKNDLGFPGLQYMYDTEKMEVDAGGTTADTGSSVYAVKFGNKGVQGVFGGGGTMSLDEWGEHMATAKDGGRFRAYFNTLNSWVGLQCTNQLAVARIKNLTTDSGKGLTDDLMYALHNKFPAGQKPDAYLMNGRSLEQLRQSRTATNATGAPAPTPEEFKKAPIIETDSLVETEALS